MKLLRFKLYLLCQVLLVSLCTNVQAAGQQNYCPQEKSSPYLEDSCEARVNEIYDCSDENHFDPIEWYGEEIGPKIKKAEDILLMNFG